MLNYQRVPGMMIPIDFGESLSGGWSDDAPRKQLFFRLFGECQSAVCSDFGDLGIFDSFCITWLMDFQWNWDLFPTNKLLCWDGYSFIPKPANFFEDSHSYDFPAQGSWQGVLSCSGPEAIQLHEGPHSSMHQKKGWSGWICCIAICGELSQWTLQIASSLSQGCLFWLGSFFVCSGLCLCCINSSGFNAMGPVNLHSLNPWLSRCHQIRPWNSSMFYVILLESSLHVSRELLYHVVSSLFSHVHWLPFGPSRIPGRLTNYVRYTKVACWLF